MALIADIDQAGGTLAAIEAGRIQQQIQDAAYRAQQAIDAGTTVVVGVNRYATSGASPINLQQIDPESEARQAAAVRRTRASRDAGAWRAALDRIEQTAKGPDNLVPPVIAAVEARATLGEISDTLRRVFGEHRERSI
jgi:methylmalonyl-CoA mutase N-terminal domain/subunit